MQQQKYSFLMPQCARHVRSPSKQPRNYTPESLSGDETGDIVLYLSMLNSILLTKRIIWHIINIISQKIIRSKTIKTSFDVCEISWKAVIADSKKFPIVSTMGKPVVKCDNPLIVFKSTETRWDAAPGPSASLMRALTSIEFSAAIRLEELDVIEN